MYVYIKVRDGDNWLYVVGFYKPYGDYEWVPENDYTTKDEAAERVHYLNGGD